MNYLIRSLKYFVALCVLCVVMMGLMLLTGTSELTAEETLYLMFHSDRFVLLGIAIVIFFFCLEKIEKKKNSALFLDNKQFIR
ncbi:MAG: hypothetical protein IIW89_06330 [Alistipes sp.]|nr:hypothetical protein [Alistipes sp.]